MLNSSTTSWEADAAPSALALYLPDTWETMTNRLGLPLQLRKWARVVPGQSNIYIMLNYL